MIPYDDEQSSKLAWADITTDCREQILWPLESYSHSVLALIGHYIKDLRK